MLTAILELVSGWILIYLSLICLVLFGLDLSRPLRSPHSKEEEPGCQLLFCGLLGLVFAYVFLSRAAQRPPFCPDPEPWIELLKRHPEIPGLGIVIADMMECPNVIELMLMQDALLIGAAIGVIVLILFLFIAIYLLLMKLKKR